LLYRYTISSFFTVSLNIGFFSALSFPVILALLFSNISLYFSGVIMSFSSTPCICLPFLLILFDAFNFSFLVNILGLLFLFYFLLSIDYCFILTPYLIST